MNKKIIIAGGTGFVGRHLTQRFEELGYKVLIISRQSSHINWNDAEAIKLALENSEMLINLAGKSVDCRYNEKNKKEIFDSRIETTCALGEAILLCENPPNLWINSSTATIYRHAEDRPMTESRGEIGSGFSVNVATNWENTFFDFKCCNELGEYFFRFQINQNKAGSTANGHCVGKEWGSNEAIEKSGTFRNGW